MAGVSRSTVLLWTTCVFLFVAVVQAGLKDSLRNPPPKCCAPDQYEANLQSTGSTYKGGVDVQKYDIRFAYDYTNLRWAYHTKDPAGVANDTRIIFDHKNDVKYLIRNGWCKKTKNEGVMERSCVPSNATYHGYFEYGIGDQKLGYDMWSYEYVLFPLRQMLKVARDTCLPIQEGGYGLVANNWAWHVPEEPCQPWMSYESAQETARGLCQKCWHEVILRRSGVSLVSLDSSAVFTDITYTIDQTLFQPPDNCEEVEEFGHDLRFDWTTRGFIYRYHNDRLFEDDEDFHRGPPGPIYVN